MNDKLGRISKTILTNQDARKKAEAEYERLTPAEKLQKWQVVIKELSQDEFLGAELAQRTTFIADYNALVEAAREAGDTSWQKIESEDAFVQTLRKVVRPNLDALREQVEGGITDATKKL